MDDFVDKYYTFRFDKNYINKFIIEHIIEFLKHPRYTTFLCNINYQPFLNSEITHTILDYLVTAEDCEVILENIKELEESTKKKCLFLIDNEKKSQVLIALSEKLDKLTKGYFNKEKQCVYKIRQDFLPTFTFLCQRIY